MKDDSIDDLKKRYELLRDKKVAAETHLLAAAQELDRLKAEAREQHGTDDLAELERLLDEMKRENQRKRTEYQTALQSVEVALAAVEKAFPDAGRPG
jgi:hypothetical protein